MPSCDAAARKMSAQGRPGQAGVRVGAAGSIACWAVSDGSVWSGQGDPPPHCGYAVPAKHKKQLAVKVRLRMHRAQPECTPQGRGPQAGTGLAGHPPGEGLSRSRASADTMVSNRSRGISAAARLACTCTKQAVEGSGTWARQERLAWSRPEARRSGVRVPWAGKASTHEPASLRCSSSLVGALEAAAIKRHPSLLHAAPSPAAPQFTGSARSRAHICLLQAPPCTPPPALCQHRRQVPAAASCHPP